MVQSTPAPASHYYSSQRLRLHYVDWGNPQAPPLLLLHGGLDHCRNWDWLAARLSKDWHVIAPDLRGHGDSQWSPDGHYSMAAFVCDLATLVEQQQWAPLSLVGHSLGGNVCLRFTGIYPDKVRRVVAIEGLGPSPEIIAQETQLSIAERMQKWVTEQQRLADRMPRRYQSFDEALRRMQEENKHLSNEQALHLTQHGVKQNDDGTYSWKFDNYLRSWLPVDMTRAQIHELWSRIACPALLVWGKESWASNPEEDGRVKFFQHAKVAAVEQAGHWVHHDQPEQFMALLTEFL